MVNHPPRPTQTPILPKLIFGTMAGLAVLSVIDDRKNGGNDGFDSKTSATTTVASMTVALGVSDRERSILGDLNRLSQRVDTSTRAGVSSLISEVALSLLRHEPSIVSAVSYSKRFRKESEATQKFNAISIQERAKYDEETLNKFGKDVDMEYDAPSSSIIEDDKTVSTMAIVTLNVNVEGNLKLPEPRSRASLKSCLSSIAAGVMDESGLLGGEVLWSPEGDDTLTVQEVYAKYPDLFPVV